MTVEDVEFIPLGALIQAMAAEEAEEAAEMDLKSPTVEDLAEEVDLPDTGERHWARVNGMFTSVGATQPEIPPGFYATIVNNSGQLFFVPLSQRTDMLLRFPHAEVDTVISEIQSFWAREEVFERFGLPYKRGILLYGPPGSGKTSALQLVARDVVERGGIVLNFDASTFLPGYRTLREHQPDIPVVVLMEDLDAILSGRSESGILNILDGAEKMYKVVFVASTNYPEKLGPRVINRPSRFDRRIKVGHPDAVGRRMYLESLVEGKGVELDVERYVRDTHGMSLAHLKELFVSTILIGIPYEAALKSLTTMHLESPSSADDTEEFSPVSRGQYA